jgi:hypothetical protein
MPYHKMHVSKQLKTPTGKAFVAESTPYAMLLSALLSVTHPKLYDASMAAMTELGKLEEHKEAVSEWPSVLSGYQVISNRTTEDHRDFKSRAEWYDILATVGPYQKGVMKLRNLGAELKYETGSVVLIGGLLVRHEVEKFEGERICFANFIRADVHERLGVANPGWSTVKGILDRFM